MGSSTQKTTSTTGLANKDANALLSTLSKGINSAYTPGGTTYTAPGANTTGGWEAALQAAGNPAYAQGIGGALTSYGNRAAGNELGINDPLYAGQRQRLISDVTGKVNNTFNNSGLFGSDSNVKGLTSQLTDSLGALDLAQRTESYGLQDQALDNLSQAYQSSLLPSSVQGAVGSAQDADAAAKQNGGLDYLKQFTQLLSGVAGSSPQTTTTTQPSTPLWQSLLGLGVSAL